MAKAILRSRFVHTTRRTKEHSPHELKPLRDELVSLTTLNWNRSLEWVWAADDLRLAIDEPSEASLGGLSPA